MDDDPDVLVAKQRMLELITTYLMDVDEDQDPIADTALHLPALERVVADIENAPWDGHDLRNLLHALVLTNGMLIKSVAEGRGETALEWWQQVGAALLAAADDD